MEFIETRQILDYKIDIFRKYCNSRLYFHYHYRIVKDGIIGDMEAYVYDSLPALLIGVKDYILFTEFKALKEAINKA